MNKNLKPCPFCGGEAGVSERYDEYCAVRCITCGAKTNFSMTKKGAIELWNRREPIDKVVKQLEECKCNDGLPADIVWNNAVKICIEIVEKGGAL